MMRNKKIEEKVQISKSDIALQSVVLLRVTQEKVVSGSVVNFSQLRGDANH